jgi:DNA mismatch endonuclease (patch repair protein)
MPKSRLDFWGPKFAKNKKRDRKTLAALKKLGWKTMVVWECELKQSGLAARITRFLA